ncbi:ABC transporter substrate-binding protein [Amycolatopsis tucumanensis]|uniref:ABC transporter substrate-binding protein n=1 Tax=Amycolatopsis tucumanensis TaxID=401106 RepID=UPI001F3B2445|nr:ABC transporter substrate-binding protein [Amycolatopsis tucumanensis]MCF6428477.1 ABC transporter substrate-binding protein [Amycolatopsis tucumanensis]
MRRSQVQLSRRTILSAVALASAGGLLGCSNRASGDVLENVRGSGTLRVALTQANPPWNFVGPNGAPAGYDVDVAHELARRLGIGKVEFVQASFQTFIEGIKAGRFDMVISGQTITDERKQQVDFSTPYEVNGISIFVPASDTTITSLADLRGKTVAVSAGTTQHKFATDKIPDVRVKTYDNATLGLTDLSRGNADAMLVSRFQGSYLASQNGLAVKPAGPLLEAEVNGISFRKDSPALKREVDRAINDMIADGTLTRISRQWLGGLDMASELKALPTN